MKNTKALFQMTGSMLIFGTIGLFRRLIPLSSEALAFLRGVIGALTLILYTKLSRHSIRHDIGRKTFCKLLLSGILIGINWMLLFEAYKYTSIATATLCYYMQPPIVILLSAPLFGEKLTPKRILCVLLAVTGMVLVSGVTEGSSIGVSDLKGIGFGLGAAVLYASVVLINKSVRIEDPYEKTIIQLSGAAIAMVPSLLFSSVSGASFGGPLTPAIVLLILLVGIVHTGIAYALYFAGLQGLSAQSAALLSYIDPVSALILSAVFLHEKMSLAGILGSVLIIGSAVASEIEPGEKNSAATVTNPLGNEKFDGIMKARK